MDSQTLLLAVEPEPAPLPAPARLRVALDAHWTFVARLLRHLGVRTELDDALQQVFITFSSKLGEVLPGKERAFLAACAVNIAARHRRRLGRSREASQDDWNDVAADSSTNPEAALERRQLRARLSRVLEAMPEPQRAVFVLYEIEELTMAEIAQSLDLPSGTVASRLRRARELFQQEFQP